MDLQDFSWKSTEAHKFVSSLREFVSSLRESSVYEDRTLQNREGHNTMLQGEQNIGLPPGSSFFRDPLDSFRLMNLSSEHYEFVNNKESPSEGTRNVESFNAENDSEDEDGSSEGRESVAAKIRRENAVASLVHDGSF